MKQDSFEPLLVDRLQPTPQRPAAAPRPRPLRARRSALLIVAVTAAGVLLTRAAAVAVEPLVATHRIGREIEALETRAAAEEARKERLLAEMAYLKTPTGIEEEARRQGWVCRGETAIRIVRPEGASPSDLEDAPQPPPARKSLSDRLRDAIRTCLATLRGGKPDQTK